MSCAGSAEPLDDRLLCSMVLLPCLLPASLARLCNNGALDVLLPAQRINDLVSGELVEPSNDH